MCFSSFYRFSYSFVANLLYFDTYLISDAFCFDFELIRLCVRYKDTISNPLNVALLIIFCLSFYLAVKCSYYLVTSIWCCMQLNEPTRKNRTRNRRCNQIPRHPFINLKNKKSNIQVNLTIIFAFISD